MENKTEDTTAQDIVLEAETGGRDPSNPYMAKFIIYLALTWSIFQLYVSSPLVLEFTPWMNADVVKRIHLMFAGFLAYLSYLPCKTSPKEYVPITDWIMGILLILSVAYLVYGQVWDSDNFEMRLGVPNQLDVILSVIGIGLLLEATRRALGPPLAVVAVLALTYAYFGGGDYNGASIGKIVSHMWITTEGAFGIAIGVSATMVFLFVLFGSLLERAGAGNYFIRVAFSLMGHFRGGPAKAAVVSSAMTGMISGSSIANVVTTGTFTIPLMKKVGFSAEKAGAIEVASSTNGQLTPPIMGAAAFLMVEYVGIPFVEIIKHAFLPALISYIALVYIVHLEALKMNMKGMVKKDIDKMDRRGKMIGILSVVIVLGFLSWVLGPVIDVVKNISGEYTFSAILALITVSYVVLIYFSSKVPDLPEDDIVDLPRVGETVKSGLHYLLPIVVLVWLLTVERLSPDLSAFWACLFMIFIVLTQKPLMDFFRGSENIWGRVKDSLLDLEIGLINGGKNMIGIGVATAVAGIIVGTVTLTGLGQVVIGLVETVSGGNIFLILLLTAIISLILGMGLPTTANYIVVSSLMAPVIVSLGAANDIAIPLIAAHMFVFYFGILADDTPPVGLAAFAAAAISKGDPIKTGIQGFTYDIRTALLPFMFIFNTQLLMIGIDNAFEFIAVVVSAVVGMLLFAAATQGFWFVKNRWWETILLLALTFMIFRPGYIWDKIQAPYDNLPGSEIFKVADNMKAGERLHFVVSGETIEGTQREYTFAIPLAEGKTGQERINETGLRLDNLFGPMEVAAITPINKQIEAIKNAGVDSGWVIESVRVETNRLPKQIVLIPAFLIMFLMGWSQIKRRKVLS
ncbi:TRAP transporter permease [Poseidonibacter lekithochrous]|uniref:TRAP transporter permease n=1 Tax=Poseidonibacter TaxID=2321187 RepID=UPI001C0934C7|nr:MULTISPECIES: TRAP transporter permease [Poseidonibacter]MBU3014865.1 TRAP transporter permease [Poseidonibacter lekithochrous]MDO6828163.1 TRAP transporter permease [Poseidonibacter sp. 1_MG-2023]